MADVKVPALLHKMSKAAQKAWYKKNNMKMPDDAGGRSAAAAKKVKVAPRKEIAVKPGSVRALNAARQQAYMAKGGRQPIGAMGSGGSNVMAGAGQSTIKDLKASIKAGFNPRVSLDPYESEKAKKTGPRSLKMKKEEVQIDEVSKKEAEAVLGGPVKEKPKGPAGKLPLGFRLARSAARKAMKGQIDAVHRSMEKTMKKEEVEQIDEAFDKSSPAHAKAQELVSNYGNRSAARAVYHGDGSATIHTTGDKKVSSATRVDHIHDQAGLGYNRSAEAYRNSSKSKGGLKFKTKETEGKSIYGSHEIHISHKGMKEEIEQVIEQNDSMEKKEMAQTQLHFMAYAAKEILEFIDMGGEIEEWYQNKLSKVQSEVESLHSYIEGEKRRTGMVKEEEQIDEKAPPGAKFERMVKHIKKGYAKGGLTPQEKSIAYATVWKAYGKKNEEVEQIDEAGETSFNLSQLAKQKATDLERYPSKDGKLGKLRKNADKQKIRGLRDLANKAYARSRNPTGAPTGTVQGGGHKSLRRQGATDKDIPPSPMNMSKLMGYFKEDKKVTEAEGAVAVTPKEKELAAHHGDPKKITYGDVIKARLKSVAAKKMGK